MTEPISVKGASFPRMVAEATHLAQYLKVFSLFSFGLLFLMTILCLLTERRPPLVLAFSESGAVLAPGQMPKPEAEIREAIRAYLGVRYRWSPKDVVSQLAVSEAFIAPQSLKVFRSAMGGIAHFSAEKQVEQRVYPNEITVDLDTKVAQVTGDRITIMQALRAATPLQVALSFEMGARTHENPWGVYITQEKEGSQ